MATKNKIVISGAPAGRFLEGIVSGTPKPGTVMQIVAATAMVSGKLTWEVFNRALDGDRPQGPIAVLCEHWQVGKTVEDAYVSGEYCNLYCPIPGDELLMLIQDVAGTTTSGTEAKAVGDLMIVDDGTGLLIDTTGTPESEPFVIIEEQAEPISADALIQCMFTGY
jgi:hypothetical protein